MSAIEKHNQYAAQILAGFAANPAIFAHNSQCGWSLVNCTDDAIVAYAVKLANALLGASNAIGLDGNPIAMAHRAENEGDDLTAIGLMEERAVSENDG